MNTPQDPLRGQFNYTGQSGAQATAGLPPTPNTTGPSAEAMAFAANLKDQFSGININRISESDLILFYDRHLAPLRADLEAARRENEGLTRELNHIRNYRSGLLIDTENDRDALRTRVAELGKELNRTECDCLRFLGSTTELNKRITALETANKALEADKARLDWLEKRHLTLSATKEDHGDELWLWWQVTSGNQSLSGHPLSTPRDAIDAALAHSGGQET